MKGTKQLITRYYDEAAGAWVYTSGSPSVDCECCKEDPTGWHEPDILHCPHTGHDIAVYEYEVTSCEGERHEGETEWLCDHHIAEEAADNGVTAEQVVRGFDSRVQPIDRAYELIHAIPPTNANASARAAALQALSDMREGVAS